MGTSTWSLLVCEGGRRDRKGERKSVLVRIHMRDILTQIARGVVIGLAIPGAIFIVLVMVTIVPSLYHAWREPTIPDAMLCRNSDFDPSDLGSNEYNPCPED